MPLYLRNAPTKLMVELGCKKGYRYAYVEPVTCAAGKNYFPQGMTDPGWYQPVPRGLEMKIADAFRS